MSSLSCVGSYPLDLHISLWWVASTCTQTGNNSFISLIFLCAINNSKGNLSKSILGIRSAADGIYKFFLFLKKTIFNKPTLKWVNKQINGTPQIHRKNSNQTYYNFWILSLSFFWMTKGPLQFILLVCVCSTLWLHSSRVVGTCDISQFLLLISSKALPCLCFLLCSDLDVCSTLSSQGLGICTPHVSLNLTLLFHSGNIDFVRKI